MCLLCVCLCKESECIDGVGEEGEEGGGRRGGGKEGGRRRARKKEGGREEEYKKDGGGRGGRKGGEGGKRGKGVKGRRDGEGGGQEGGKNDKLTLDVALCSQTNCIESGFPDSELADTKMCVHTNMTPHNSVD